MNTKERKELYDYLFYIIDMVALVIALIFSATDAYSVQTEQLWTKVPLIIVSVLFKYVYLGYYVIANFVLKKI